MNPFAERLEMLRRESRLRSFPEVEGEFIDLTSNDYLGLQRRKEELQAEFFASAPVGPFSSSASRLLLTDQRIYTGFERFLGDLYGKEALLFNSGYHANVGMLQALAQVKPLIVSDKLIHASAIDGIRLSGLDCRRFRHNDMANLRQILEKHHSVERPTVIVVESIYSMDGDIAPLMDLVEIKREYPGVMIYLDEAHAIGVRGKMGLGVAEELGIIKEIDIIVGTLGKAAMSAGAFAIVNGELKDYLLNFSRSLIFSTALPPINVEWSRFIVERILGMESERRRLAEIAKRFGSETQIVPIMVGDASEAVKRSKLMREQGILALPIRKPTVPEGTERIRLSLNAALSDAEVETVLNAVKSCV